MLSASPTLTATEFEAQFTHEKPYYELWNGEPIQKSMPTWIHGLLQRIIMDLLKQAGYKAASEVKLRINSAFQPVPDIIATAGPIEIPYPTKPVEIIIEILSEDDPMSLLLSKCRTYQDWGFQQIYVVDPGSQLVFRWSDHRLEEVTQIANQPTAQIWATLTTEIA